MPEYEYDERTPSVERKLEDLRLAVRAALRESPAIITVKGAGYLLPSAHVDRLREMVKHVSIYDDDYDAEDDEGEFDTEADQAWREGIE